MEREYFETNRKHWDGLVPVHVSGSYYGVEAFKAGKSKLKPVELAELTDVAGKTLLHLQCHFGLDTLSWTRKGAAVTGVDFSEPALEAARALAAETGIEARFILSDVYSLPGKLDERFDIVFTSYGAVCWLPDLARWAQVVAHFVRPGGTFYMVEFHPVLGIFDWGPELQDLSVRYPYFPSAEPIREDSQGSYADPGAYVEHPLNFSWPHPLSEVLCSLIDAGLRIDFLHEFPFSTERHFGFMEQGADAMYRLTRYDGSIPMLYSIKATKPSDAQRR